MANRKLIALESESGVFLVDEDGVAMNPISIH